MSEELAAFEAELEQLLVQQAELVENDHLQRLKQCYRDMKTSFDGLHNVLKKNGVLREDPYKYEEKLSEVDTPSDDAFLDSERDQVLSLRLAQFEQRLDFLNQYVPFTLEHLNLKRLKDLVQFTRFINWRNLSETASQPTTRGLAELIAKIKRHGDSLSTNIAQDAQEKLNNLAGQINDLLKYLAGVQRERYKLDVRRLVFPALPGSSMPGTEGELNSRQSEELFRRARNIMAQRMEGQPLARDLIMEIVAENHPTEGQQRREALLEQLRLVKKEKPKESSGQDMRPMLVEAIRALATAGRPLEEAMQKLGDNVLVLENRRLSFGEFLRRVMQRLRGEDSVERRFPIEYVDEHSTSRHTEEIDFDKFSQMVTKRAKLYGAIFARSGNSWRKIQSAEEEQLLSFINKDIQQLQLVMRQMEAIDTYLRAEVPREQRVHLRGINVETTAIQEHMQRARKRSREYVAKKDEIEQLRRLGISV